MVPIGFISKEAAAGKLQVSISTIHKLIKVGSVKAIRFGGKVAISDSEIARVLQNGYSIKKKK